MMGIYEAWMDSLVNGLKEWQNAERDDLMAKIIRCEINLISKPVDDYDFGALRELFGEGGE